MTRALVGYNDVIGAIERQALRRGDMMRRR
jgi:hypothetical protein